MKFQETSLGALFDEITQTKIYADLYVDLKSKMITVTLAGKKYYLRTVWLIESLRFTRCTTQQREIHSASLYGN